MKYNVQIPQHELPIVGFEQKFVPFHFKRIFTSFPFEGHDRALL